jgi:sugar O-acyltransferase (sialic acid O-acetyltransferase NeuD family)
MRKVDPRPLLIFPFNGNGIEALDCLGDNFRLVGFIDDTPQKQGAAPGGMQVYSRAALEELADAQVLAVPGSPTSFKTRRATIGSLGLNPLRFATVVHPTAWISPGATIGRNVLIMAGVVVTSNAVIGDHVCVLPNSVIHHDSTIGNWSLIGSNVTVAGGTHVGENCYVGSGCSLMNGLQIGARSIIGLGSTVIRDCAADSRLAGNPARLLP